MEASACMYMSMHVGVVKNKNKKAKTHGVILRQKGFWTRKFTCSKCVKLRTKELITFSVLPSWAPPLKPISLRSVPANSERRERVVDGDT